VGGHAVHEGPDSLQSNATVAIDWYGDTANTDDAESDKLDDIIGSYVAPFIGMKLRTASFTRDAIDGGTIIYQCGLTTTGEDVINEASGTTLDPLHLESAATTAAFNATPPNAQGDGFVKQTETTKEYNDGQTLHTAQHGLLDTKEKREFPGTGDQTDPRGIDTKYRATQDYLSGGSPPQLPTPPPGTKLVGQHTERVNRLVSERVADFATRDSADARGFEREHTKDDPLNIDDDAIRWKVWNEGDTPPAAPDLPPANNVKLVAFDDIRLTPTIGAVKGQFLRWFLYGARSTGDEHKLPNYSTDTDPFALENHAVRAGLDGEAFVDPGAAFVLRMIGTKPLTLGLGVNRLLTVKVYGVRTTLDDRQMPHRFANADAQKIESDGEYLEVYNTADGEPADPTPTLGELQNVGKKIEEIDQQHSQKTTKQDVLNSAQRRTFPKIKTDDDPQNIEDESFRSQTWSGTAPDDPDDPPSNNVKLILRTDVPLTPGTATSPAIYQRIWLYGPKDSG
jgi:hypothetical protein